MSSQRLRASKADWLRTKAGQKQPGAFEDEHDPFKGLLPAKELEALRAKTRNEIAEYEIARAKIVKPAVITGPLYVPASNKKELHFVIFGEPCCAPRMTRRDKWLKPRRPCVQKYFDYRDRVRSAVSAQNCHELPAPPDGLHCVFYFTMPESWSKKKKVFMIDKPHRQTQDVDNAIKGCADALFENDSSIWKMSGEKRWCAAGQERVTITMIYE